MSAQSIEWHEQTLSDFTAYRDQLQREADMLNAKLKRMTLEIEFRKLQIETAKAKKKDSFDPDKFLGGFDKWKAAEALKDAVAKGE